MRALSFDLVSHAELISVSAAFTPGTHVVLGSEADGTATLVSLAAGLMPARAGHVQLNGVAPFSNATLRRSIGALCAIESLPPGRALSSALELALRARGDARSVTSVLSTIELTCLTARRCSELSARELRAVALALALSHPKPSLLALHEPLDLVPLVPEALILDALHAAAENGAIVLVSARRVEDATRLGGQVSALERGIWLPPTAAQAPMLGVTLRVQTPDAQRLAALLAEAPEIERVTWAGAQDLLVRGADLERVAWCVVKRARAEAMHISAMRQEPPTLEALTAARANAALPNTNTNTNTNANANANAAARPE